MLGLVLIACTVAIGMLATGDPSQLAGYLAEGVLGWQTIQLVGIITMVEMLAVLMDHTGGLERSLLALRTVISDVRVLIALVPTLLGPLPVPGGAMLSAPAVGKYGDEMGLGPVEKASINLFFRHMWDLLSPFKPTVILAAAVLNIPMFTLIGWQVPIAVLTFIFGYWYMVGHIEVPVTAISGGAASSPAARPVWVEVAPLVIPVLLALTLRIDFVYAMGIGLAFGLVAQRVTGTVLLKMIKEGVDPRMIFTLVSVMVFKVAVERSEIMTGVTDLLAGFGIPLLVLVVFLPMAMGHAIGMELPAVALVFPLVLAMLPEGAAVLPYALVMLTSNAVGSILSPVHVCVVVGNNYYGAEWHRVIWRNLPAMAFRLSLSVLLAWILATFLSG